MKEYREPHVIRAAAEAFNADDTRQGYRLLDENQVTTERKVTQPGTLYTQDHTSVTVGTATDLVTFHVPKDEYISVFWYVFGDLFTGATYTITAGADDVVHGTLSPFSSYVGRWDTDQDVTLAVSAGWGWSGGAGPVDFTGYAAIFGGSIA